MTRRGVAYIRVSTEEQAKDDKYGIPSQKADIEKYCRENGITIADTDWYIDEGVSGASRRRPAFSRILSSDVQNPPVSCVVVAKADRISRDVTTYYVYKDLLARKNIEIVSVKEDWGSQDKITATILEGFMAIMASVERETISLRTSGGRRIKAKNGGYSGGNAPYGYKIVGGEYAVEPKEAAAVLFIFDKYAEGMTPTAISRLLNADQRFRPRHSEVFYPRSVSDIIKNKKTYQGWYRYGGSDWVKGRHQALLPEDEPKLPDADMDFDDMPE